jgi:CRISPR-associated protein Csx16
MTTWFVSRHPGALKWAALQGLQVDSHAQHLDPLHVQMGDAVMGNLPIHLVAAVCARGAKYYNLSLDIPAHWRGRELTEAELQQCNARLERFEVCALPVPVSFPIRNIHL